MPMEYIFSTLAMGFKVGTLLLGAMFFSGGMWVQALSRGQQASGESKGALPGTRYTTYWSDIAGTSANDAIPGSEAPVRDCVGRGR